VDSQVASINKGSRNALRAEDQVVAPFIFKPEQLPSSNLEENATLQLEWCLSPTGAECNVSVLGGESNQHGWNESPQRHSSIVDHGACIMP
jgi:hypothetical protein